MEKPLNLNEILKELESEITYSNLFRLQTNMAGETLMEFKSHHAVEIGPDSPTSIYMLFGDIDQNLPNFTEQAGSFLPHLINYLSFIMGYQGHNPKGFETKITTPPTSDYNEIIVKAII